jgi:hypothetical protein
VGRGTGRRRHCHPPTIQALLEARLDKLDRSERAAAEPAAVIGLEFESPAVQSLVPAPVRAGIDEKLQSLSRKHFIRPAVSPEGDVRYRFDHHMVRETVYNGLLKRARATMHAEFVKWADQANADSDRGREFEEILGYHLEQAYKYLGELGPIDEAGAAIGRDGAKRLSSAARRALARGTCTRPRAFPARGGAVAGRASQRLDRPCRACGSAAWPGRLFGRAGHAGRSRVKARCDQETMDASSHRAA